MKRSLAYIKKSKTRLQKEYFNFLRIPSVSADPAYKQDMLKATQFLKREFERIGLDAVKVAYPKKIKKTPKTPNSKIAPSYPVVTGEKIIDPKRPTVLIYGHYDVQPPDPLDLWKSPPFSPTVRGGRVYARGANDNKGQIFSHIKAVESCIKNEELPVNIKFLIEGEEEISSKNLLPFVIENKKHLQADYVLISDTEMMAENIPAITYGLRGICFLEIVIQGPKRDLHSGMWGGVVANPATALTKVLAALTDASYQVKHSGFYQGLKKPSSKELQNFNQLPWSKSKLLKELGMKHLLASNKKDFFIRNASLPTFDINGIDSGYTGEGEKTIIPSWARAKISFRLVPNQDYQEVLKFMSKVIKNLLPKNQGLTLKITRSSGGNGFVTDLDSPGIRAAQSAFKKVFGHKGYLVRSGATIPIVTELQQILNADVVMMGFGLAADRIHSPNESYLLKNYYRGIESSVHFLFEIAK